MVAERLQNLIEDHTLGLERLHRNLAGRSRKLAVDSVPSGSDISHPLLESGHAIPHKASGGHSNIWHRAILPEITKNTLKDVWMTAGFCKNLTFKGAIGKARIEDLSSAGFG